MPTFSAVSRAWERDSPGPSPHQGLLRNARRRDRGGTALPLHLGLLRADLDRLNVVSSAKLAELPDKALGRVAELVLVRQRPPTAKGTVFISLEDETGMINLIIWKRTWERFRKVAKQAVALYIEGKIERAEGVIHVCPTKIDDLSHALQGIGSRSRDFR